MAEWLIPVFVVAAFVVAFQASWRGYRFSVWFLAALLVNPVFLIVLLANMPDFARKRLRAKFAAELQAKLAQLAPIPSTSAAAPDSVAAADLSVGDRVTFLPRDRSLGDEETHG
jgi:hypothetical protein